FEGEIGIGAQAVLAVGEELHVPVELPAEVEANAGHERLRIARLKARNGADVKRDDRVAVMRPACRRAEQTQDERMVAEGIAHPLRCAETEGQRRVVGGARRDGRVDAGNPAEVEVLHAKIATYIIELQEVVAGRFVSDIDETEMPVVRNEVERPALDMRERVVEKVDPSDD